MDGENELREFLVSRRARITPEQAKLPAYGGNRRVAGLRREEVAMLAGVSVDYYTKLERGAVGVVSPSVLDAVARALQLTSTERDHLFHLTGTTASLRPVAQPERTTVRPTVQRILDGLSDSPAFVATTSSPPTLSDEPSTRRCTTPRPTASRTPRATRSWSRARRSSSSTGARPPPTWSRTSGARSPPTRSTERSSSSSTSSTAAAPSSASSGGRTTSAPTTPGSSASGIRSSANST